MKMLSRRAFVGVSLAAFETLRHPILASAAPQCLSGGLPAFLPNRLTVDCASRKNFKTFRQNSTYLGLTGVVSMSFVRGKYGSYPAGNLFLFPWLKDQGKKLGASKAWGCVLPTSATATMQANPVPGATLPVDEYFCRIVLQSPWTSFIGVMVDEPHSSSNARLDWFSNIDRLADGKGVGIDWTSHNLNNPWFGGSRSIPKTDDCSGRAWRQLIADGLMQASVGSC